VSLTPDESKLYSIIRHNIRTYESAGVVGVIDVEIKKEIPAHLRRSSCHVCHAC
jgi:hypothetical protein